MMQQMPGQAPQGIEQVLPQMQGQQGAAQGVSNLVGPLSQLEIPQLLAEFNNPGSKVPKYAVLSAIEKKQQQQRAMQAVQGAVAQSQNAQMQGQGTVADQIMGQARQMMPPPMERQSPEQQIRKQLAAAMEQGKHAEASYLMDQLKELEHADFTRQNQRQEPGFAYGGEMHGYAGGGAVAFRDAGVVGLQNPEYDEEGLPRTNEERLRIERNNRIFLEQQRNAEALRRRQEQAEAVRQTSQPVPPQMSDYYRSTGRDRAVTLGMPESGQSTATSAVPMRMQDTRGGTPEMAALAQMLGTGAAPTASPRPTPGAGQQRAQAAPPASDVGKAQFDALQQAIENQASNLRTMSQPSDEERLARQQARQADAARLAEEQKTAREFREGAAKQYADVQQQVSRPLLEDNAQLALLGAGITGRRGETARGLLQGIGAIEANKQARLDAARKEMREDTRTAMQMEAVNRQLEVAQKEKAYADMRGDREASLAAEQKIAELQQAKLKLGYDYAVKKEELKNQGIQAAASMMSAQKPTAAEATYGLFKRDPEGFKKFIEAQQEPKGEASIVKAIVAEVVKNPLMLSQYPPEIQALVKDEIAKLRGTKSGAADPLGLR